MHRRPCCANGTVIALKKKGANTRLAECSGPQDEEVMIVAAKEKKHHCRSVTKLITNGAMQGQTDIKYVSEKGIERGSDEESIHMAVPRVNVLLTCPSCWFVGRLGVIFLRSLTTTVSVIRFGLLEAAKIWMPRARFSSLLATWAAKTSKVRSLSWRRKIRRGRGCFVLAAVALFLEVGAER